MSIISRFKNIFRYSLADFWAYEEIREKGMAGDLTLVATPTTLGSSAAAVNAGGFTRDVVITLETAAGDVHSWFNGEFAIAASEVTAGDGTVAIQDALTEADFDAGKATVTLVYSGTWASGDTATLTVTGKDILGYTVANATSVDTLVA